MFFFAIQKIITMLDFFFLSETHEKGDNKIDTNAQLSYVESNRTQNLRYPKRVFLILGNEFCERFMYYGLDSKLLMCLFRCLLVDLINGI